MARFRALPPEEAMMLKSCHPDDASFALFEAPGFRGTNGSDTWASASGGALFGIG
jgi:hypothetical protein